MNYSTCKEKYVEINNEIINKDMIHYDVLCFSYWLMPNVIWPMPNAVSRSFPLSLFKSTLPCVCENAGGWLFVKKVFMMMDFIHIQYKTDVLCMHLGQGKQRKEYN